MTQLYQEPTWKFRTAADIFIKFESISFDVLNFIRYFGLFKVLDYSVESWIRHSQRRYTRECVEKKYIHLKQYCITCIQADPHYPFTLIFLTPNKSHIHTVHFFLMINSTGWFTVKLYGSIQWIVTFYYSTRHYNDR